jgi:hypothetical protein
MKTLAWFNTGFILAAALLSTQTQAGDGDLRLYALSRDEIKFECGPGEAALLDRGVTSTHFAASAIEATQTEIQSLNQSARGHLKQVAESIRSDQKVLLSKAQTVKNDIDSLRELLKSENIYSKEGAENTKAISKIINERRKEPWLMSVFGSEKELSEFQRVLAITNMRNIEEPYSFGRRWNSHAEYKFVDTLKTVRTELAKIDPVQSVKDLAKSVASTKNDTLALGLVEKQMKAFPTVFGAAEEASQTLGAFARKLPLLEKIRQEIGAKEVFIAQKQRILTSSGRQLSAGILENKRATRCVPLLLGGAALGAYEAIQANRIERNLPDMQAKPADSDAADRKISQEAK